MSTNKDDCQPIGATQDSLIRINDDISELKLSELVEKCLAKGYVPVIEFKDISEPQKQQTETEDELWKEVHSIFYDYWDDEERLFSELKKYSIIKKQ